MDFYIKAAKVICSLDAKKGSIKGLTLQSGDKNGPRTYALVLQTLKYREVLEKVIKDSGMLVKERKLAAQGLLSLVLVHDLLLNKAGIVSNAGPFKDAVLRHKTRLNAEWIKAKIKLKAKDNTALAKRDETFIPRWARVNTLKSSMEAILDEFGFPVVDTLEALQVGSVYIDTHIQNLLAFHPDETLSKHKHYLDGSLVFQNKASCIPAAILNPIAGAHVIDACAAPGNKTSHLAALLQGKGKVFAFERDPKRVQVLSTMLDKAGANCTVAHQDFTRTNPRDPQYAQVTHLLLDPSCSGSGIVNRLDYLTEQDASVENTAADERLESLAAFQLALLLHAMKFPAAEKITYSTCSVHAVENEGVVMAALAKRPEWQVASRREALPGWPRRGIVEECGGDAAISEGLVRAMPGEHGTIGFFVATFVRRSSQPTVTPAPSKKEQSRMALTEQDRTILQQELDLLTLLHHRNKNQHHSAVWFRHLATLKTTLARLLQVPTTGDAIKHFLARCKALFIGFSQIIGTGQYVALGAVLVGILARCWRVVDVHARRTGVVLEAEMIPISTGEEKDVKQQASLAGTQVTLDEVDMGQIISRDGSAAPTKLAPSLKPAASEADSTKSSQKLKQKSKQKKRVLSSMTSSVPRPATKKVKRMDGQAGADGPRKDEIDDIFG